MPSLDVDERHSPVETKMQHRFDEDFAMEDMFDTSNTFFHPETTPRLSKTRVIDITESEGEDSQAANSNGNSEAPKALKNPMSQNVILCKVRAEVPWEWMPKRGKAGQRVPRSVLGSQVRTGQRAWLQPGGCALMGC